MLKVEFNEVDSIFLLKKGDDENGYVSIPYKYIPNCKNIFPDLKDEDFDIILLNNPFLHKEVNWYEVFFDGSDERGGFLLPISLLESEEITDKRLLSYMFVTYGQLLLRIDEEPTMVLSDSFPDAYVLAIHKQTKPDFQLKEYVLSLAHYGYYEYKKRIGSSYPRLNCIENQPKNVHLWKADVDNLQNGYVKDLITNRLCLTTDFLTRFVLVYQIVELYISEIHYNLLEDKIDKYKKGKLTRNEFSEELKIISRESCQIKHLVRSFHDEEVSNKYKDEILSLFNDLEYTIKDKSLDSLLYVLRNQLFHNYGIFKGQEDALNQVIFSFERVILMMLSKKLINDQNLNYEVIGNEGHV